MRILKPATLILAAMLTSAGCTRPPLRGPAPEVPISASPLRTEPPKSVEIQALELGFDQQAGVISYVLPEDALVRIRIGVSETGPLLRTLLDWEFRGAGRHEEPWDKMDQSGSVSFAHYETFLAAVACMPLDATGYDKRISSVAGLHKAPGINVTFPGASDWTDEVPIVAGVTPVRVTIAEADRTWMTENNFEVLLYIDEVFLSEEEEGITPYTFLLNTRGISEGMHVITANVAGYEGEMGSTSARFYVRKEG